MWYPWSIEHQQGTRPLVLSMLGGVISVYIRPWRLGIDRRVRGAAARVVAVVLDVEAVVVGPPPPVALLSVALPCRPCADHAQHRRGEERSRQEDARRRCREESSLPRWMRLRGPMVPI